MFELVRNTKSADFPQGNCKIAWDRLVSKYALHTASFLLKLKSKFHNSNLELMENYPDEWILNMGGLQISMNEFKLKSNVSDEDFMIHILKNLPKEYNVILNRLENCLMATRDNVLTIDAISKKLNHWYKIIKSKKKKKVKEKRP